MLEAGLLRREERLARREADQLLREEQHEQLLLQQQRQTEADHEQGFASRSEGQGPPRPPAAGHAKTRANARQRGADAAYFEALAGEQDGEGGG